VRALLELIEWILGILLTVCLVAFVCYEWGQIVIWAGRFTERILAP
jgi:hypothetical protein